MQHRIPAEHLGPHGGAMANAVSACVHCGFCLPACPTYRVMGEEMDSPRGRIVLMKQALEGELKDADVLPYIDRCLGCLACETACPSGVRYRDLLTPFRSRAEGTARVPQQRLRRRALLSILESPVRFRHAVRAGFLARQAEALLPTAVRDLLAMLPPSLPEVVPLPSLVAAQGPRRGRVALLTGCVQQVLRPSINAATLRVLAANGVEVVLPTGQRCCGALATHSGFAARGEQLAAHNASVFPADVDAVIVNAAGCGSAMKDARAYPAPVRDICEFLDDLGLITSHAASAFATAAPASASAPAAFPQPLTVAYHDACHLAHGQNIRAAPRRLLNSIDGVTIAELHDRELCCGSAGLYNLEHAATARELGIRKAAAIRATGAQLVTAGNIGCLTQIEKHLEVPVVHTIELLNSALRR